MNDSLNEAAAAAAAAAAADPKIGKPKLVT